MGKFIIKLEDIEQQDNSKSVNTDGYLFVYIDDNSRLHISGRFDMKVLMPMIAKYVMEKFAK